LLYCENRLTSNAGVSLKKNYQNYFNTRKLWNSSKDRVSTCKSQDIITGNRVSKGFDSLIIYHTFEIG